MASLAKKIKVTPALEQQPELIYREDRANEFWESTLFNKVYLTHDIGDKIREWHDDEHFAEFQDKIKNILNAYKDKETALESMSERNLQNTIIKDVLCALNWADATDGPIKPFIDDVTFTYKEKTYKPDIIVLEHSDDNQKVEKAKAQQRLDVARQYSKMVVEVKYWKRIEKQFQKIREEKDLINKDRQDDISGIVTPNDQTIKYMELLNLNWGILTDGSRWRLFNKELSQEGSDRYFEFDFNKLFLAYNTAETPSEHALVDHALRYFFHFFSKYSFYPLDESEPLVNMVLIESKKYADKIEEDLKDRFLEAMNITCNAIHDSKSFKLIAKGEANEKNNSLIVNVAESILFNILFIKSLETRRILPMISTDYKKISLTSMLWKIEKYNPENSEIRNAKDLEKTFSRGNGNSFAYTSDGNELHDRIVRLVNVINKGTTKKDNFGFEISGFKETIFSDIELNVFTECKIPNKDWVRILFMLGYTKSESSSSRDYQLIPYEFFTPRQLGSIYESFLEFKLDKAESDLVFFKKKWQEGNLESEKVKQMDVPKVRKGQLYFTPNNEERKATGSYYTPDEVVQLIVNETLGPLVKNKTSKEILKMKVADTAMGSGHFLSGALNYLSNKYLESLKKEVLDDVKISPTDAKQEILHNCIFGADINARAVKLAKMSLWLESASTNKKLENLDDQVKCTNSLTDFDVWKKEWKFLDGGIDAVVGNPPYLGEKGHKEVFQEIATGWLGKRFYQGKMDLFYFFFHLGLDILKPGGRLGFITTNYYTTALGAKYLRFDLSERANIDLLMNLNELRVFGEATGQHNMITILTKAEAQGETRVINSNESGKCDAAILSEIYSGISKKTTYSLIKNPDLYDGDERYIRIGLANGSTKLNSSEIKKIVEKIKKADCLLGELFNVSAGIMGGCDYINKTNIKYTTGAEVLKSDIQLGDGVFVLDSDNARDQAIIKTLKVSKFVKPFFKNSDIGKFHTNLKTDKRIIFSSKDKPATEDSNIKAHLFKYKSILAKVRTINKENTDLWPVLRRGATNEKMFSGPKIVCPQRSKVNKFGYNEENWYASCDVYFITANDKNKEISLKYVLGLLNSKLYYFWLYTMGKRKGEALELYQKPLSEIPFKRLDQKNENQIVKLVDNLLHAHDKHSWDRLNKIIYETYSLTKEEIKIIDQLYYEKVEQDLAGKSLDDKEELTVA